MKKLSILLAAVLAFSFAGCMDHHDDPTGYTYGNPAVGEANTTIAQLKETYRSAIQSSSTPALVETPTIIEGVVVADDESGNIYKQLYVRDATGTIVVGINSTGLYAYCPVGQKIVLDCTGLHVGGYGQLAQIGSLYNGSIGRMEERMWKEHVRFVGTPNLSYPELQPVEINDDFLENTPMEEAPLFVKVSGVTLKEADGEAMYAPEEGVILSGNEVNRNLQVGDASLIFRVSTYANFATEVMPTAPVDITGVLTRFRNDWQLKARTSRDIILHSNNQ